MSLDMYLFKCKRYKGMTVKDIVQTDLALVRGYAEDPNIRDYMEQVRGDFCATHDREWPSLMNEVGYWRKADHIHNWFVNNVQNGEDDCDYYEVSPENLDELLIACNRVLAASTLNVDGELTDASVAEDVLPRQDGFFGNTTYNDMYLEDIRNTVDIINEIFDTTDFDREILLYHASW